MTVSDLFHLALAYLRRDLQTIKFLRWIAEWVDAALFTTIWYFVARLFSSDGRIPSGRSADYFTFSLVGLAMSQYVWRGFAVFSDRLKSDQMGQGFETLWVSAYPMPILVIFSGLWDFLAATVNAGIILLMGTTLFGAQLQWAGILSTMAVGLFTCLAMGSLGLLTSSWVIAWGGGSVAGQLLNKAIPLVSGAFFPVSLFPWWLKALAWCFPLTHAITLSRGILIPSANVAMAQAWNALLITTACFMGMGWWSLTFSLRLARVNGRIAQGGST